MSAVPQGPYVPPGQYPPFTVVTDTDHTAWIIIATSLGLSIVLVFGFIRATIKTWSTGFSHDGTCLAAATFLAVIQASVILGACAKGLGKSIELIPEDRHVEIQRMVYVSMIMFEISLGLSKTSVVLLLLSLTPDELQRKVFRGAIGLFIAWTLAAVFAAALTCNLSHPWITIGETCTGSTLRWQIISVFDIIFEISIVAMAVFLVWSLRTSRSNKMVVVIAFAFRLPMIITIGFRLGTFDGKGWTTNPTLLEALFLVWSQTELNYSIISAIIPSLRPFVKNLSSNYGQELAGSLREHYGTGSSNYQLSNLAPGTRRGSIELQPKHKGNPDDYTSRVWANKKKAKNAQNSNPGEPSARKPVHDDNNMGDGLSVGSSDSQRMIIKKDVSWLVEHGAD